ncbi:MAG: hypothetical protein GXO80_04855 [Chlorobi bacterium]|nr:hypothetical protein [Chlorobiota bacterium]
MLKNAINIFRLNYKYIYSGMLMIIVAVLPHSRYLLSMSEIGLVFFWILEGNFKIKVKILKTQPEILVFASIFIIHLIGLIYTQNFAYAFKDLKIKLPLLIFPIVLGTSLKLSSKEIKQILIVFTISILIKTFYGTFLLSGLFGTTVLNPQHLAGKYSHIRYALMLNIVAFTMVYFLIFNKEKEKIIFKILYLIIFIWISVFLLILHSVTGWVIYLILFIFSILRFTFYYNNRLIKAVFFLLTLLIISGISLYIVNSVQKFYKSDIIVPGAIEHYTKSGNSYKNNFNSTQKENGHFVNLYLCEKELKEEWNKVSKIKYDETDKDNQPVKYTLIRYLTSKNLRKDKDGVKQLSKQDIENIENGMTNYIFADRFSLYPKIYEILWQMNRYASGGSPDNQSISQRFEFLKNGKEIIKRNFWFGVGTGDVKDEYKKQYKLSNSKLSEKHRLRAHNQYVTIFITFGFFGFLWFMFALFYPIVKTKKYKNYLFLISFIIIFFSMLNEDTLETQMGATIFAFFLSFFLFVGKR